MCPVISSNSIPISYATLLASELRITIQVLAPMWISFIFGAVTGALIVSSFPGIGLLGIVVNTRRNEDEIVSLRFNFVAISEIGST